MFIARGSHPDFGELDQRRLAYITELLTGLTVEQLRSLGVKVVFMETQAETVLAEFPPA